MSCKILPLQWKKRLLVDSIWKSAKIPIEKLEDFRTLLINYYETNIDNELISFMKEYCIKRVIR